MDSSAKFRRIFANRIANAVGLSALLLPAVYACSGTAIVEEDAGAGGSTSSDASSSSNASSNNASSNNASSSQSGVGGSTPSTTSGSGGGCSESSSTSTGGLNFDYSICLDEMGSPCPADTASATAMVQEVLAARCCDADNPDSCEQLVSINCGPFAASSGQCCFEITTEELYCAVPGRPFSDCGEAMLSMLVDSSAWIASIARIECGGMTVAERRRLADKWSRDGLAEHASVASFARFALQLMAVGAPAELVADAQRAALDEVEHARLAFAVASVYAGRAVGPGPFPLGDAHIATDLVALAVATVEEGCINETLSTVVARAELEQTTDPAVRAVLSRIIEDETRHAELAWQTVAWALRVGGPEVREAVAAAFARTDGSHDKGIRDVVRPCARALLAA